MALFLLKVGWAVYLSFVVAGYYGRIESLQRDVDQLNGDVRAYQEVIVSLEKEAASLKSNVTDVATSVEEVKLLSKAAENQARNVSAVVSEVWGTVLSLQFNIKQAQGQLKDISNDVKTASTDARNATFLVRALNSTLVELSRGVSAAVVQAEDAANSSTNAVEAVEKARKRVEEIQDDVRIAKSGVELLEKTVLPGIVANVTEAVERARNASGLVEKAVKASEGAMKKAAEALLSSGAVEHHVRKLNVTLLVLQHSITAAVMEASSAANRSRSAVETVKAAEDRVNRIQTEVKDARQDVADLKQELPGIRTNVTEAVERARNASGLVEKAVKASEGAMKQAAEALLSNEKLTVMFDI